jgi:hypothetical protein
MCRTPGKRKKIEFKILDGAEAYGGHKMAEPEKTV